ncbi:MAG: hypothetical protein WC750_06280 [Patescibacteria group bacterium]|jgi:hypothetical protein
MIFSLSVLSGLSLVISGIAIAGEVPNSIVAQHPDAAQVVIVVLFAGLCGLVAMQWRGARQEVHKDREDFKEAMGVLVKSMTDIGRRVEDVCIAHAELKGRCDAIHGKEEG